MLKKSSNIFNFIPKIWQYKKWRKYVAIKNGEICPNQHVNIMNIMNIMNSNKNIMNYEPKQKIMMHESFILLLI